MNLRIQLEIHNTKSKYFSTFLAFFCSLNKIFLLYFLALHYNLARKCLSNFTIYYEISLEPQCDLCPLKVRALRIFTCFA